MKEKKENLKAHTKFSQLQYLKTILHYFDTPDIISINAELFKKDKITPYEEIKSVFKERSVAIRSSAADEDGGSNSLAGEYESVLNVPSNDLGKIISAIDTVIDSKIKVMSVPVYGDWVEIDTVKDLHSYISKKRIDKISTELVN
jgi:hypothetical protein